MKLIIKIAITYAALIASKFTPIIYLPIILLSIFTQIKSNKIKFTFKSLRSLKYFLTFSITFFAANFIFMPYFYLNYQKFITDIKFQMQMNSDAYAFPYTLQYVGTVPYLYYLKNILLWGLGPVISIFLILGLYQLGKKLKKNYKKSNLLFPIFYLLFNLYYFLIIGRSAVKFMRYMLPLYPFITIMAGYGFYNLIKKIKLSTRTKTVLKYTTLTLASIWTLMFVNIYAKPNSRVIANAWIHANIPARTTLAVEHWDDRLPLTNSEKYNFVELNLYDLPDDKRKWRLLNQKLNKAEYIILASNRLYIPLQKLDDCSQYKKCYPQTSQYYQNLFAEKLGFYKIAEFSSYPSVPFFEQLKINDEQADESFTVYDHPKVTIFKKIK